MALRLEDKLVAEWRQAWKLWSVQLNAIGLVLMGAVEILQAGVGSMPPALLDKLPYAQSVATACFVLGLVARLLKQGTKKDPGS